MARTEEEVQLVIWTIEDHVQCSLHRWQVVRMARCGQVGAAWIKAHLWDTILNWTVSKTKKQTKIYQRAIILIYCLISNAYFLIFQDDVSMNSTVFTKPQ